MIFTAKTHILGHSRTYFRLKMTRCGKISDEQVTLMMPHKGLRTHNKRAAVYPEDANSVPRKMRCGACFRGRAVQATDGPAPRSARRTSSRAR